MANASICDACGKTTPMQFGGAHPVGWVLVRIVPDFQTFIAARMAGLADQEDKVFCGKTCSISWLMTVGEGVAQ